MALYENISAQLQEIEILESMFPAENELYWHNKTLYLNAKQFLLDGPLTLDNQIGVNLKFLCFEINFNVIVKIENNEIEKSKDKTYFLKLNVTFPSLYPKEQYPEVFLTSNDLPRNKQTALSLSMNNFIASLDLGSMMILEIVLWLQNNAHEYYADLLSPQCLKAKISESKSEQFMCLYMHHIYNKEKRKNICYWAEELLLTGFLLPGKPGVVYVEGATYDIEEYFERLRKLSWKKMTCKLKDVCEKRKFNEFQELSFGSNSSKNYHNDMGKFFTFLKDNNIGYLFKCLFGVES
ncbi:RWD domain-containing protein 2B [Hydra vulgaris]|uniref:RWD domain-containing protein 2B n=1 Tax=Hydra vulgaris TaxID=6087 RepID=A0ABM4C444_HYDVU